MQLLIPEAEMEHVTPETKHHLPIEKRPVTLNLVLLLVTLGTSVTSIGYQLARLDESTRRIQELELRMAHTMSTDDALDIKRRLEKIEDKVDSIKSRQR